MEKYTPTDYQNLLKAGLDDQQISEEMARRNGIPIESFLEAGLSHGQVARQFSGIDENEWVGIQKLDESPKPDWYQELDPTEQTKIQKGIITYNLSNPDKPVTYSDIPNRPGILGTIKEFGSGLATGVKDVLPQSLGRFARNTLGEYDPTKEPGTLDKFIAEQSSDMNSRVPSAQRILEKPIQKGAYEGGSSLPLSVATMAPGALVGGIPGAALSAAVSYPVFYGAEKDSFLEDVGQAFIQKNGRKPTQEEWTDIYNTVKDAATESGLWEAGTEAAGQAFSTLLFRAPVGKYIGELVSNVPGKKGAITRFVGKSFLDYAEEVGGETASQYNQQNLRNQVGVVDKPTTVKEAFKDVAIPLLFATGVQGTALQALNAIEGNQKAKELLDRSNGGEGGDDRQLVSDQTKIADALKNDDDQALDRMLEDSVADLPDMRDGSMPIPFNIPESDLEAQAMEADIQRQIRATRPAEPVPARPKTPQEINQARIGMTEAIGQEIDNIPETDGSEWARMEDEANAEADYWNKTKQEILKQREPKAVKPLTTQQIMDQKIRITEDIGSEIQDVPEVKTGYQAEQEKLDTERDIFLQKLDTMQNEVNGSRTRGVTQEKINQPEAISFPADSPEWMREVQEARKKDGKSALGRAELNTLFDKVRSGKPLTENQQDQFNYVQMAAQKYAGPAGEMVAQEEADDLEKRGFDLLGGRKMAAGNLNQGDKVVATIDGVKDEFEVKDTNENGEVLLQDGIAKRVDMFDEISVEAHKPAGNEPEMNQYSINEDRPMSTGQEAVGGNELEPSGKQPWEIGKGQYVNQFHAQRDIQKASKLKQMESDLASQPDSFFEKIFDDAVKNDNSKARIEDGGGFSIRGKDWRHSSVYENKAEAGRAIFSKRIKSARNASYDFNTPIYKHEESVKKALSEGKPVPASVLADYPDLSPTTAVNDSSKLPDVPAAAQSEPVVKQNFTTDITAPSGKPFTSKGTAVLGIARAKARDTHEVVKVDGGWVGRVKYQSKPFTNSEESGNVKPFQSKKEKQDGLRNDKRNKILSQTGSLARLYRAIENIGDASKAKLTIPSNQKEKTLYKLGQALGLKTRFFRTTDPATGITGFTYPGTDELFLNLSSDVPIIGISGHEIVHQIKANHPDLYDYLVKEFEKNKKDYFLYVAEENVNREMAGLEKISEENAMEEFIADFANDSFQRPEFWDKLYKKSPSMFQDLIDTIKKVFGKIKSVLTRAEQYILDVDKAQESLATVIGEAMRRNEAATGKQLNTETAPNNPDIRYMAALVENEEDVSAMKQAMAGMKKVFTARKDKGKDYKPDTNFIDSAIGLLSHYSEKVPALEKTFEELLMGPQYKHMEENLRSHEGDLNLMGVLNDFSKKQKLQYQKLNKYIVNRDMNAIGNILVEEDGKWSVKGEKDKTGKRKLLQGGFASRDEARTYSINHEVETYNGSTEEKEALKAFRLITSKVYDGYIKTWNAIVEDYEKRGLELPKVVIETESGEARVSLKTALAKMGDRESYYFPRQRESGDWKIVSKKPGQNPVTEFRDSAVQARFLAGKMEARGYKTEIKKVGRLAEDVYLSVKNILNTEATINQALSEIKMDDKVRGLEDLGIKTEWRGNDFVVLNGGAFDWSADALRQLGGETKSFIGTKENSWSPGYTFKNAQKDIEDIVTNALFIAKDIPKDISLQLSEAIVNQMADTLRSRGSMSRMIARYDSTGKDVHLGYETDLVKATAQLINSAAGGEAKRRVALNTSKAITGRLLTWEEFQEQHDDADTLYDLEAEKNKLIKNSPEELKRINSVENKIRELQKERTGVKVETDKNRQARLEKINNYFQELNSIRKWSDENKAADINRKIVKIKSGMYQDYQSFVEKNRIDIKKQKNAYKEAISAVEEVLRNDEAADRVIGTLKGMASVWFLGGKISSAAINLTTMGTSVPAAMKVYGGIPMTKTAQLIGKASKAYLGFKTGVGSISAEDKAIFEEIDSRGWLAAQLNMETINALKSGYAKKYGWVVEKLMTPFKVTEEFNRAVTLFAAYKGVKAENPSMTSEEALKKAKKVSDRAHGIYGKENTPSLLRHGRGLNALSSMYVFQTYFHNYMATMAQAIGRGEAGAAAYMMLSPIVFGGIGSSLATVALRAAVKAFGGDDPEEEIYNAAEKYFGTSASDVVRYGLPGLIGISLKGSLAPNLPDFSEPIDLLGPIGGMAENVYQGGKYLSKGDYSKGVEGLAPGFIGNVFKGYREATEGVTSKSGRPIFFGKDQVKGDAGTGIMKGLGFNTTKTSKPKEIQWNETKLKAKYQEMKADIYNKYFKFMSKPLSQRTPMEREEILMEIKDFNNRIKAKGLQRYIPLITNKSIKQSMRSIKAPKRERLRKTQENQND